VQAKALAAVPVAELGMVGMALRCGERGVELADGSRC